MILPRNKRYLKTPGAVSSAPLRSKGIKEYAVPRSREVAGMLEPALPTCRGRGTRGQRRPAQGEGGQRGREARSRGPVTKPWAGAAAAAMLGRSRSAPSPLLRVPPAPGQSGTGAISAPLPRAARQPRFPAYPTPPFPGMVLSPVSLF